MSEKPNGSIGEFFGLTQPQVPACSVARTTAPSPEATSTDPTTSRRGFGPLRGASSTNGVMMRIPITMTTSPTNTTRQLSSVVAQPPTIGPMAMPAPATPPMIA